ncbi:MAG: acyl carrier protein [Alteromonadaceae bacterium]|nr:MAG: acyl carrier protein [Alteromonadaceae bacterium]
MNSEKILDIIISSIKEVKPDLANHSFLRSDSMADDLGAHSVERSEVIMITLQALTLRIPLVQIYGPKNIGELADLLATKFK